MNILGMILFAGIAVYGALLGYNAPDSDVATMGLAFICVFVGCLGLITLVMGEIRAG